MKKIEEQMMLSQTDVLNSRYQLQQLIGENTSRQTWLATDTKNQQVVVVKLLAFSSTMAWEELKLFEREAQTLQRLDHPYIPKYLDYFYIDELPNSRLSWFGLVQSHIDGKSLQQMLDENHHFSVDQVEQIATETLNILAYLHDMQPPILHRDIKPSNLIWGDNKRIYLVDFGAVQDSAAIEGMTFTVVGTYGYVPMEQFGGRAEPASDLYALGATLIHLITGITPAQLPQKDTRLQFADLVSLDVGLVNWLSKLVEPQLSQRFRTTDIAIAMLKDPHLLTSPLNTNLPRGSRIQVNQSVDKLRIKIPHRGKKALTYPFLFFLGTFFFNFLSNISKWIDIFLSSGNWWLLYEPMLYGFGLFIFLTIIMLGETTIHFDRLNFEIRWQIFGLTYRYIRGKTSTITRIVDSAGMMGIVILYSNKKFAFTNAMSTVEQQWLKQEIAQWLELPLEGK